MDINMTDKQYREALQRQYERIVADEKLVCWDDTTIGCKETHNSWGLCSIRVAHWPDPESHLWPDQFIEHGRVAPRYRQYPDGGQFCPFDRRAWTNEEGKSGCFWFCMFFTPEGHTLPNQEQAKALTLTLMERYDRQKVSAR